MHKSAFCRIRFDNIIIMDAKKKCANFTKSEIDVMVIEIETKRDVLFGKMGVGLSAKMKKRLGKRWQQK